MVLPPLADLTLMAPRIAIIGCGNPNRGDDGAGPEVLRLLRGTVDESENGVRLLDAGSDGMVVMFAARGCQALILVDACQSGAEPGAIFEVPGAELEQPAPASFNLHDFRWDHALYAGRRIYREDFPQEVTVFLIEAGTVALGIGLSEPVSTAAGRVAARITDRLRSGADGGQRVER
jgi:hydrogenase maturation protease